MRRGIAGLQNRWHRRCYLRAGSPRSDPVLPFRKQKAMAAPHREAAVLSTPIDGAPMLWVLGSLCQIYRIPFDSKLILQRFAPPYTLGTLCEAAESLGLSVGEW